MVEEHRVTLKGMTGGGRRFLLALWSDQCADTGRIFARVVLRNRANRMKYGATIEQEDTPRDVVRKIAGIFDKAQLDVNVEEEA